MLNKLPKPPYYAVIFTSQRFDTGEDYENTAQRMMELAHQQPGFLGVESLSEREFGMTVSYWKDLRSIAAWKQHIEHLQAQRMGRERWYRKFRIHITRVERVYEFAAESPHGGID